MKKEIDYSSIKLLKSKWFLYATAFFSGMSVMAVELAASRLLAPYFSSSQVVWTIIIGTIMIALALGHIWGGRSADKEKNPTKLYLRLLVAAIWIALIPLLGKFVISGVTVITAIIVDKNLLVIASLLSCLLIFVFPLMLLGTVSPSLIKFSVKNLTENGKIVGELEALSTVGSILGTFLPTFVTIPALGTSLTFLIFSIILLAICAIYFISIKIHIIRLTVISVIILSLTLPPFQMGFAFWDKSVVYEDESIYSYMVIKDSGDYYHYMTNVAFGVQSTKSKFGYETSDYHIYGIFAPMAAGILPLEHSNYIESCNAGKKVLILGLAMGTYAELTRKYYGGDVEIVGVEIDKAVVKLAQNPKYFGLSSDVEAVVSDGRAFLQYNNKEKYDVIFIDAYQDITIPFYMGTVEFFKLVKSHLTENGIAFVNLNMRSQKEGSFNDYLVDTMSKVFDGKQIFEVTASSQNSLFFVSNSNEALVESLNQNYNKISASSRLRNHFTDTKSNIKKVEPKGKYILTDDKAPVELIGARLIDDIISDELDYYRKVYKEKGIKGLFELLK